MNITPEECFDRSTFLYRKQIEKIQQQMFQKKRQSLLMSQSTTFVNSNSLIEPVNTNIETDGKSINGSTSRKSHFTHKRNNELPFLIYVILLSVYYQ